MLPKPTIWKRIFRMKNDYKIFFTPKHTTNSDHNPVNTLTFNKQVVTGMTNDRYDK